MNYEMSGSKCFAKKISDSFDVNMKELITVTMIKNEPLTCQKKI